MNSSGNWDAVWNSSSYSDAEWNVTFNVTVNDTLGNIYSIAQNFSLDNVNPSIQLVAPPVTTNYYNSNFNLSVFVQDSSLNYTNYSIANTSVSNSTLYPNNITTHTWSDLIDISSLSDGIYNITTFAQDAALNTKTISALFILDTTSPILTLNSPATNLKTNETSITFNWTVIDNLASSTYCNLSVNGNVEKSNILCTNNSACTYVLGGFVWADYTWNVTCWDNASNINNPSGRVLTPDWRDIDGDSIHDTTDKLIGNENNITQGGTISLEITIGGNSNLTTFNNSKTLLFYDNSSLIINFTHNFSTNVLDLREFNVKKNSSYILINHSNQLQGNKTMYIGDENFTALCIKDMEIANISEMTPNCFGEAERDFSECIGNSSGITIDGIICTDLGSRIRVDNLQYSAIRGTPNSSNSSVITPITPITPITKTVTPSSSSSGGGCTTNWICSSWGPCVEGVQTRVCTKNQSSCYAPLNKKPIEVQNCSLEKDSKEIVQSSPDEEELITTNKNKTPTGRIIRILIFVFIFIFILGLILKKKKKRAKVLKESYHQIGKADRSAKIFRRALAPGKRKSKYGNIYYEHRRNRSDIHGKLSTIWPFGRMFGGRKRKIKIIKYSDWKKKNKKS